MSRQLTGSVTPRGNVWRASVPRLDNPTRRLETTFLTESEARSWVTKQLRRLEKGHAPELPERTVVVNKTGRPHASPSFADAARSWHQERYVALHGAQADRTTEVLRDLELHVIPVFAGLFDYELLAGRALIVDWLRAMSGLVPLDVGSVLAPAARPYAKSTVTGILWILTEVIDHSRAIGLDVPDYAAGRSLKAMTPVGKQPRRAQLVTLAQTVRLAAQMHVIHQLVLWTLRLAGMRISEVYGLLVEHFFIDDEGDGFLFTSDQGGRAFKKRAEDESLGVVHHKEGGKTDAAFRLIALPHQMASLIQVVIDTYHTDAEGRIDTQARLVPKIRSTFGGQDGFRSALKKAAQGVEGLDESDDLEEFVIAHDFRKSYATDLAWNQEISGLLSRRTLGHRAGADVFDLVYTLDTRLKKYLAPVARALEADLVREAISTLMIPTARRALHGNALGSKEVESFDSKLAEVGWLVPDDEDRITVSDAAALLGMAEKSTRRLMGGDIAAVKTNGGWRARMEDVLTFRDRFEGKWLLREVAEKADVSYQETYRLVKALKITPERDTYDERVFVLSEQQARQVFDELERVGVLAERSVKRGQASKMLGVAEPTIGRLLECGLLLADDESDATGGIYVTLSSIDIEIARRQRRYRKEGC